MDNTSALYESNYINAYSNVGHKRYGKGQFAFIGYDYYMGPHFHDWNLVLYHFLPGDLPSHIAETCVTNQTYYLSDEFAVVNNTNSTMTDEMRQLKQVLNNNDIDAFDDGWIFPSDTNTSSNSLYIAFSRTVGIASVGIGGHVRLADAKYSEPSVSSVDVNEMESQLSDIVDIELQYTNDFGGSWVTAMDFVQFKWEYVENKWVAEFTQNNSLSSTIDWSPLETSRDAQYWRIHVNVLLNENTTELYPQYSDLTIEFAITELQFGCEYYGAPFVYATAWTDIYGDYTNVVNSLNSLHLHEFVVGLGYYDLLYFSEFPNLSKYYSFIVPKSSYSILSYVSSDDIETLQNWVENGGTYICFANSHYDLSTLFGIEWIVDTWYLDPSTSIESVKASGAAGTVWEHAPNRLNHLPYYTSTIGNVGANETLYSPIDDSTVATVARASYGDGSVVMIGYNWDDGMSFDWMAVLWYAMYDPHYKTSNTLKQLYTATPVYYNSEYLIYSTFYEANENYALTNDYYPENCYPITRTDSSNLPASLDVSSFEDICSSIISNMGLTSNDIGCVVDTSSSVSIDTEYSSNCIGGEYNALFSINYDSETPTIWVNPYIFDWNPNSNFDESVSDCNLAQKDEITILTYVCQSEENWFNVDVTKPIQILWEDDFFDWQSVVNVQKSLDNSGYSYYYAHTKVTYLVHNITSYAKGTTILVPSIKRSEIYDYLTEKDTKAAIQNFMQNGGNFVVLGDALGIGVKILQEIFDVTWQHSSTYAYSGEC